MKKRILLSAVLLVTAALSLTIASALGAGGRLQLYLVNSGPATEFYNDSVPVDGDCGQISKPASLAPTAGTAAGVQYDSPGYAFGSESPSVFSYTVPAGGAFKVPASPDAVVLKLWSFSGDGSCPGQTGDQSVDWRVLCSGPTCGSDVSLTGPGQSAPKAGWQNFSLPAGTPSNTLFNVHAGPSSAISVGIGDVIRLELSADTWAGIQWNAQNGAGSSSVSILRG